LMIKTRDLDLKMNRCLKTLLALRSTR